MFLITVSPAHKKQTDEQYHNASPQTEDSKRTQGQLLALLSICDILVNLTESSASYTPYYHYRNWITLNTS